MGIMFTVVPIFIFVVAGFVFFGVISTFLRSRKIMDHVTDEVFRQARDRGASTGGSAEETASRSTGDFSCDKCGAALGSDTEISPSGDFKCEYCDSWNNVHK